MAINAPIQGTSADIIKLAMIKVGEFISREKFDEGAALILTVHDELVYEIKKEIMEKIRPEITKIMQDIILPEDIKDVPLVVSSEVGDNWGEMDA